MAFPLPTSFYLVENSDVQKHLSQKKKKETQVKSGDEQSVIYVQFEEAPSAVLLFPPDGVTNHTAALPHLVPALPQCQGERKLHWAAWGRG